jgi:polyhydroxyalkanoate synthase subunit PhaC
MPGKGSTRDPAEDVLDYLREQTRAAADLIQKAAPPEGSPEAAAQVQWAQLAGRLHSMWTDFQVEQLRENPAKPGPGLIDPVKWIGMAETVFRQLPLSDKQVQQDLWNKCTMLIDVVLAEYGLGQHARKDIPEQPSLPLSDRRFASPEWREKPFFAVVHQLYLLLSAELRTMAATVDAADASRKAQLEFSTRVLVDALSPANFPVTNPAVLARAAETQGESLVKGLEHLLADMRRGQLTHTDPRAFVLGENIAVTPGKVVYETPLFQLIQYTPTTEEVLETPLVIFPPWINRFYILDLNAKKSFVRWAVEQGVTVFMVSWKSADASMAGITWDDYIAAQVAAVDHVRERLSVPSVHTIGYCVAGTTLAATLAVLARKGEAAKIASATFFTAQVDFEQAGDLKNFVDTQMIDTLGQLTPEGYLDGRYLAATFNMLRGNDLLWSYVEKNYLKGEDHPAFDLLHWNGDVTNLPARWHRDYLRDLYRDNRLVVPDSLSACGVPIDLRRIETPLYIQAGREDHIAPPESVWKLTQHVAGPWTFLLAGSGHIAGVVNPPVGGKYGYRTNPGNPDSLAEFVRGAEEHPGSWWPHWRGWLGQVGGDTVPAKGKRRPGSDGEITIEDAPGRYVMTR